MKKVSNLGIYLKIRIFYIYGINKIWNCVFFKNAKIL
jgi:hypothetical protein